MLSTLVSADNQTRAVLTDLTGPLHSSTRWQNELIHCLFFFNLISLLNITWILEARDKIVSYKFTGQSHLTFQLTDSGFGARKMKGVETLQRSRGKAQRRPLRKWEEREEEWRGGSCQAQWQWSFLLPHLTSPVWIPFLRTRKAPLYPSDFFGAFLMGHRFSPGFCWRSLLQLLETVLPNATMHG